MREIEFKAWLKHRRTKIMCKVTIINFNLKKVCLLDTERGVELGWYDLDDIQLIEYTGLKNKNGVKIFDGDIVENIYSNSKYELFWDEENCCFRMRNIDDDYDYLVLNIREAGMIEVIGNIYENKELLD